MNLRLLIETLLREQETDLADTVALRNLELDLPPEATSADALRSAAATIRRALEEHSFALTWIGILDNLARQAIAQADALEGKPTAGQSTVAHHFGSFQLPGSEGRDPSPMYATMLKRKAVRLLEERSQADEAAKEQIYELSDATMAPYVAQLRQASPEDGPAYNERMIEIAASLLVALGRA